MQARIRGVSFVGDAGDATFTIDTDGLRGWFDGVDTRMERVERPAADGDFDVPAYLTGRSISISGLVLTRTPIEFEHCITQLLGIPSRETSRLTVESARGVSWADVRRVGKPDVVPIVYGSIARYQIEFWAPDPRRYGETRTFGPASSVQAHHYGNFPASPVLEVSGSSAGGYTITGPGGRLITVTQALTSGNPHTLNLASGGLYVGGSRVLGKVSVYQPWTIPPARRVSVSTSAGQVAVRVGDTFV